MIKRNLKNKTGPGQYFACRVVTTVHHCADTTKIKNPLPGITGNN
nr:hypothetical protein [Mucilaginibacter sp. FT3.2]